MKWGTIQHWKEHWKSKILVIISLAIIYTCGILTGRYYSSKLPIVIVSSYEDKNSNYSDNLNLINTVIDNRACLSVISRWLWRPDPEDPLPDTDKNKRPEIRAVDNTLFAPPVINAQGELIFGKPQTMRLIIPLPQSVVAEPGRWNILNEAIDICDDGVHGPRYFANKPITITDK